MYPVALNLKKIPILLVGSGELVSRRLAMLKEAGATDVTVVKDAAASDLSFVRVRFADACKPCAAAR